VIEEADLAFKRPGTGIAPFLYSDLLGRRLRDAVPADTQLFMDLLLP
jgi:sialic acid synthase SpsE